MLLTLGVLVTALYSFRMYFLVFHGKERMDEHSRHHLHETPWVVTLPLILLAIPSVVIGWYAIEPLLVSDWFSSGDWHPIVVHPEHDTLHHLAEHWHGQWAFVLHGMTALPFFLAMAGLGGAAFIWWHLVRKEPEAGRGAAGYGRTGHPGPAEQVRLRRLQSASVRRRGPRPWEGLLEGGDQALIDGAIVNGSARSVGRFAGVARRLQTGYLYDYAIAMIIGLIGLLTLFVAF